MRAPSDTTILIVDDDDMLRAAILMDFKRKGFRTFEAANGVEAYRLALENQIDLILSDVRMPHGDGIELLKKIKEHNPSLPVVMFVTGFADMSLEDAYDLGADAVFSKPFDRKALFAAVLKAVSNKDEVWSPRHHERVDTDFDIQLGLPTTEIRAHVLNIGRGGIFVAMAPPLPQIGDLVNFHIQIELAAHNRVSAEGKGVVRWIRSQNNAGLPEGCGIEFIELSEPGKKRVIEIIAAIKSKAFIPKK